MLSLCNEGCRLNSTTSPSIRCLSTISPYQSSHENHKTKHTQSANHHIFHCLNLIIPQKSCTLFFTFKTRVELRVNFMVSPEGFPTFYKNIFMIYNLSVFGHGKICSTYLWTCTTSSQQKDYHLSLGKFRLDQIIISHLIPTFNSLLICFLLPYFRNLCVNKSIQNECFTQDM